MGALSLDNEFQEYWSKLTVVQKQLMLDMAKSYVNEGERVKYSVEEMEELYKRREEFLKEGKRGFTAEQSLNNIRSSRL
ncbi:MAG TPA: hypothetical protein VNS32_27065 [Flavisolibacter sp.]|nr:hypothetical protein [Flavisolibacter sp.]